MRWDELFADIESQLEHELDAEAQVLAAEEERLRLARLGMRERLLAMGRGAEPVTLVLADGETLALRVGSAGRDWIAGEIDLGRRRHLVVVPLASVSAALPGHGQLELGLAAQESDPVPDLAGRLGLAFVLRDLCRRRVGVELSTRAGRVHGTLDRVGRDHLDLAEHEAGEPRRDRVVRRVRIVPFEAILRIRA
ncbi:MAG: hypothetical protein DI534_08165 [Leifsonia xyli]|nr:MAG: hypothetical protein DI534_08165 [Leifsonia xyli]